MTAPDTRAGAQRRDALRGEGLLAAHGLGVEKTVIFGIAHDLAVPVGSGIYVISDLRGPLYVGQSRTLRKRYGEHRRHSHNPLLRTALCHPVGTVTFSWVTCPVDALDEVETRFIRGLHPICNQQQITWIN